MHETRELPEVITLLGDEIERAVARLDEAGVRAAQLETHSRTHRRRRWPVLTAAATVAAVRTGQDRKSTRLNSSHSDRSRMPSSA